MYYGVKFEEIYCPPGNRSILGALLLVQSHNTFAGFFTSLFTWTGLGGWFDLGTMPRPSPAVESLTST